jgi:tRNA A-37 threonylcarbamoyl transferase component Bud32/outer membrane protein assembly factor BamB
MSATVPRDESGKADDKPRGDRAEVSLEATRDFVADPNLVSPLQAARQLGQFRLVRELGRGGMGTVYEAEDLSLGRRVALKVLRFGALADAASVERFQREAATVAKLHHTNIVPIFSVGSLDGVHFYAMQFIDGRNLADVLRDGPIDVRRAAQWALQAAEALAHAHRHGVIHRDVKPSNILLDDDELIWLTDFGLARRLDDPALTATDSLLGTPRYMSPEQASLKRSEVDSRTDIYSLGAALYELITGRPAFDGESSHHVIQAILTVEPDSPRRLRPEIPRDLDTIVMKCLAKEPSQRYASAGALADDLRAFLEGRTIRARQPSLAELAVRFLRRQRRGVLLTIGSIAATLLLTLAISLSARVYHRWQLGFLTLTTEEPPLTAELLDEQGETVVAPVSVPTQQPLELSAGGYTLRASAPGQPSETMRIEIARGHSLKHALTMQDEALWPTIDVPRSVLTMAGRSHDDLLLLDDEGLQLVDGSNGASRWTCRLVDGQRRLLAEGPGAVWPWDHVRRSSGLNGLPTFDLGPLVLSGPLDLNGDGHTDVVIAARHQAWLLAVSGADGKVFWFAPRGADVSASMPVAPASYAGTLSTAFAPPQKISDVDRDGIDDLLVAFGELGGPLPRERTYVVGDAPWGERAALADPDAVQSKARRWVEAISGANGNTIWQYEFDAERFHTTFEEEVPTAFRWFVTRYYSPETASSLKTWGDGVARREAGHFDRQGQFAYAPQAPRVVGSDEHSEVLCVAGRWIETLDLGTGKSSREPVELPFRPGRPVQWVDLDGDRLPEVVSVEEIINRRKERSTARIVVWSLGKQAVLWQLNLEAFFPRLIAMGFDEPQWPVVADLNDDGRYEMLFPHGTSATAETAAPYGWLSACDAATGKSLWRTKLLTLDEQVDHFVVGPDIDGDGYRDVFAASLWGADFDLYVEALSGHDGRVLWTSWRQQPRTGADRQELYLRRLGWWSEGRDGWPRLAVAVGPVQGARDASSLLLFSTGDGHIDDEIARFEQFDLADLDGDGQHELLQFHAKDRWQADQGGRLDAFRGATGEQWCRLGPVWQQTADLNGDRLRDLAQIVEGGTVRAMSGADGRLLWTSRIQDAQGANIVSLDADLNGDAVSDLFVWNGVQKTEASKPLHALSGKNGRRLWTADFQASNVQGNAALVTASDLDGDGKPEVVLAAAMNWGQAAAQTNELWLLVLSGRNGSVTWRKKLIGESKLGAGLFLRRQVKDLRFALATGDFNKDGVRDLVVPAQLTSDPTKWALLAIDGRRGGLLWEHPLPPRGSMNGTLRDAPVPLVADLDEDGEPEVYALELEDDLEKRPEGVHVKATTARLVALATADGQARWSWEVPIGASHLGEESGLDELANRPRAWAIHRTGRDLVCLNLLGQARGGFVAVFDTKGNLLQRFSSAYFTGDFRVWTDDVTGDGQDDLLFVNGDNLQAVDPESGATLWQTPFKRRLGDSMLGFLPALKGPATVVVQTANPQSAVNGLDGMTGRRRWICSLPRSGGAPRAQVLDLALGDEPPTIQYNYGAMTIGWQSRFVEPPQGVRERRPIVGWAARHADPRLARPLPWRVLLPKGGWTGAAMFALCALFYCIGLIVLPIVTAAWLLTHRRWSLRTLAALHLVAAMFLAAWVVDGPDYELLSAMGKPFAAVAALPVILILTFLIRTAIERRWRRLFTWLLTYVVLTVVFASWQIARDWPHRSDGQYYKLEGWYWIWLMTAYSTMVLVPIIYAARAAWRWYDRHCTGLPTSTTT